MAANQGFAAPPPAEDKAETGKKAGAKQAAAPEVAYREVPPAIEDVTVEGITRTRIPHAQAHYDDLKMIASDYNWYRYSGCYLPSILAVGFLLVLTLGLTFWQGPMNIIEMRDGVARRFYEQDDDNDGGVRFIVGYFRITGFACGFTATALCLLAWAIGRYSITTIAHFLAMFFYLCTSLFYFVAAGYAAGDGSSYAHQCFRNQWVPQNPGGRVLRVTSGDYERCDTPNRAQAQAETALVLDFIIAFVALFALVWLFIASGQKAWKRYTPQEVFKMKLDYGVPQREMKVQDKGLEGAKAEEYRNQLHRTFFPLSHVKSVHRNFTVFLVLFAAALLVVSIVFTILLHENRPEQQIRDARHLQTEYSGWPKINNRIRIAANATGILLLLLQLVPWRSRVVAYLFGISWTLVCILLFVSFGFDVGSVSDARDYHCDIPNADMNINCEYGGFEAVCVVQFLAGFVLLCTLVYEYLCRKRNKYDGRKIPILEVANFEKNECFLRPVVPEPDPRLRGDEAAAGGDAAQQLFERQPQEVSAGYYTYIRRHAPEVGVWST